MTKDPRRDGINHDPFSEQVVHDYLCRTGRLIPQTVEDVAAAEAWVARQNIELPESLKLQSGYFLSRKPKTQKVLKFTDPSSGVPEGLARAAREGNAIAPEVEEQMKKDRELKEREADRGE